MIEKLPNKFIELYNKALPFLKNGRDGDVEHALEVAISVLEYSKDVDGVDIDVLVPVAIMHDIGHSAILPEHFKYVTGGEKLANAKLVHMLAGAKIANDILDELDYDKEKSREIVEIISIHDMDQLKCGDIDTDSFFDTANKKFFHDVDSLDRYSYERIKKFRKLFPGKSMKYILDTVHKSTKFFYDSIKSVAEKSAKEIERRIQEDENN